jgi:hypothetical protein
MHAQSHKREAFSLAVEYLLQGGGYHDQPPSLAEALGEDGSSVASAITGVWASTDVLPHMLAEDIEVLLKRTLSNRTYGAAAQAIHAQQARLALLVGEAVS